ncbi:MAG TPA: S8 family peptidase [Amycolatopsis sp.]|nr:S8 family peptidase [Amycolatopsis sp.]
MGKSRKLLAIGAAVAAIAGGGTAVAQAREGQIRDADTPGSVTDSYIVVLKDTGTVTTKSAAKADIGSRAQTLGRRYNAKIARTYSAALPGFSINATATEAQRLAADSNVAYVVQNHVFHVADTQQNPPSWGLDRIDQRNLPLDSSYTYSTKADNVTAYVIDTGVRATHETFGGRVSGGKDFIDNDNDPDDENGHGTHVAGTIGGAEYGVAKGVHIVPVRVLDAEGSGTTDQVVAGIDWVAGNAGGPSVANMSLGGTVDDALDQAVKGAIAKGVTFAVAAGNDGADASDSSPARVPEAITVAASDKTDKQASFSNYGSVVDLYAPGVNITSSWGTGDTATNTISGTSMATPHVTGAAARYLASHPTATPAQVSAALTGSATPDKISNATAGTPNKLLYTAG